MNPQKTAVPSQNHLNNSSISRFLPFGGYRTTPTTNPGTTDQGFTGHKHNDYIKMIYMGTRWYLPGLGPDGNGNYVFNSYELNSYHALVTLAGGGSDLIKFMTLIKYLDTKDKELTNSYINILQNSTFFGALGASNNWPDAAGFLSSGIDSARSMLAIVADVAEARRLLNAKFAFAASFTNIDNYGNSDIGAGSSQIWRGYYYYSCQSYTISYYCGFYGSQAPAWTR